MRILVAEDDRISRELLRRMLESEGKHTLALACDGDEAWKLLLDPDQAFDACITDIQMPGLDGLELATRIRAHDRLGRLPIVLCTAANDRASVQRAAGLAVNGYIVKPYTRHRVMDQLLRIEASQAGPAPSAPGQLEDEAVICERLGIDAETRRTLLQSMLGDLREWLAQLRAHADGAGRAPLVLRAAGFKGACLSLGAARAAQQLAALQLALPFQANPPALQELEKEIALIGDQLGVATAAA
jgi:two-component system chemotaxis response regulator CheY